MNTGKRTHPVNWEGVEEARRFRELPYTEQLAIEKKARASAQLKVVGPKEQRRRQAEQASIMANKAFGYKLGLNLALQKLNVPEDVRTRMLDAAGSRDMETFIKLLEVTYAKSDGK